MIAMLTYSQRRVFGRILWVIALIITLLCFFYILSVALSFEAQLEPVILSVSPITYLIGRKTPLLVIISLSLLSSREDRATVETDPSARVVVGTVLDSAGLVYSGSARFQPSRAGFVPTN